MFSPDLLTRSQHSTFIIDGKLYSWGGRRPNLPHVHDSVEKKSLTSFVEVFDIPSLSWSRVSTLCIPPAAAVGYSCASINDTVYYFGGSCMPDDCIHNDLFALNTTSKEWNHVLYANEKITPMAKSGHCMIAFKSNKEDYLLIIGGMGPLPASTYMCSHAVYRSISSKPNLYCTNETHILCVSSLPAQWTLPEVTGMPPPPIVWCSVNTLPSSNRAILFGGMVIDDNGFHRSNDVYIITYTKNQVNYAKLDYSPLDYRPKGRFAHSSTILRANGTHHLLVVGGEDGNTNTISDCWILDINKRNWRKIDVPDSATRRFNHSISSFPVSDNCVWIIITGGDLQRIRETNIATYVSGPSITVIIELVYSNGKWSVTGMWNNELIANHSIRLTLLDKLREGTISGALVPDETEQLRKKLEEEKKKNDKLKSVYSNREWSVTGMWNNELIANHSIELMLLNRLRKGTISSSVIRRLETEQLKKKMMVTQEENVKLQSVHRKITVGKHQEIEELSDLLSDPATKPGSSRKRPKDESDIQFKKMKMSGDDDHDVTTQERNPCEHEHMEGTDNFKASIDVDQVESVGRDDKLEILREEVERLQDVLIKKDEEPTELKEHRNESELKDVAIQCSSIVPATVYSDEWRVTNVWDSEQLVSEKSCILSRPGQHQPCIYLYQAQHAQLDRVRAITRDSGYCGDDELPERPGSITMTGTEELRVRLKVKEEEVESLRKEVERLQDVLIEKDEELTELKEHRNESELKDVAIQSSSIVPATDACKIDVGIQFNYASLETDHLQGVTISSSKLFTVRGDQLQSLIWPGHGFELHFPANTCLPGEECDIMVDAVVGGDFVFPEGVEPVSAIYIISITSKLHMPSLLKIQHCVALDKASKHSRLSFYRALLKEPNPPYHFRRVKGGKFDINSQFGELELPAFCAMGIGKDSPTSSEDESGIGSSWSNTGSSCGDLEQEDQILLEKEEIEGVDDSIMYFGQVFYMKKHLNEWEMKFIVVKHIEAFTTYIKSKLKQYEENVQVNIRFSSSHIELVLDREEAAKGWSIEPYSEPLVVSLKVACSFGYEKEVTVPPTCMVGVYGDNSITGYVRRLHHPVFLKGALIGDGIQEPKIYIKRTMTEKDDSNSVQTQHSHISLNNAAQATDIELYKKCIKDVMIERHASLCGLIESSIEDFAAQMHSKNLITHSIHKNPSFKSIMECFKAEFETLDELKEVQGHCGKFLSALHNIGGPLEKMADRLKKAINEKLQEKMNLGEDSHVV